MLVIRECNINSYLNQKESKSQSNESNPIEFKKKSKLVDKTFLPRAKENRYGEWKKAVKKVLT